MKDFARFDSESPKVLDMNDNIVVIFYLHAGLLVVCFIAWLVEKVVGMLVGKFVVMVMQLYQAFTIGMQ